jgi:hypothetical protein
MVGTKNGSLATDTRNRDETFPDLESTEGLGMKEKSRLDYDHTRQLTVTIVTITIETNRTSYLLVFIPTAILVNEDLDRCYFKSGTRRKWALNLAALYRGSQV